MDQPTQERHLGVQSGPEQGVYGGVCGLLKSYCSRLQRGYSSRPRDVLKAWPPQERRRPATPSSGRSSHRPPRNRIVVAQDRVVDRVRRKALDLQQLSPDLTRKPRSLGDIARTHSLGSSLLQQDVGDKPLGPHVKQPQALLGPLLP